MDKTRRLRRELGYQVAKLHGLQESVDPALDDVGTKALALQIRQQAGVCLHLLDQYQSSVPSRMWLDAERRCRPLREDLRRTEKLFRSNAGEWEGRTLLRDDLRRMCDWTWDDFHEPAGEPDEVDPSDGRIDSALLALLATSDGAIEEQVPEESIDLDDDEYADADADADDVTGDGMAAPPLRFTLPMDEESRGHMLVVLVPSPSGLVYDYQYGGSDGRHIEIEGFLVPLRADPEAKAELEQFFLSDPGPDRAGERDDDDAIGALRAAVARVRYRGSGDRAAALAINDERLGELDEAWVPVMTPDGPGYLAWINAD